MNIMYVAEAWGGGVYHMVNALVNHFSISHSVTLVHGIRPETPANYGKDVSSDSKLIHLPSLAREISPSKDRASVIAIRDLMLEQKPDIVHAHSSKAGVLTKMAWCWAGKPCPLFYTPHNYAHLLPFLSWYKTAMYKTVEKLLINQGTTLACSQSEGQEALRLGGNSVVTIPNGIVDNQLIALGAGSGNMHSSGPQVIGYGRNLPQKNPALFDEVAHRVSRALPNVAFVWVGGGDFHQFKHARTKTWLPRDKGLRYLRDHASVYLQTSKSEGLPLATMEAMALGIPVVVTDIPGNKDLVAHGISGYLGHTVEDLAQAVIGLITDPAKHQAVGQAGRQTMVEEHSLDKMFRQYEKAYANGVYDHQKHRFG